MKNENKTNNSINKQEKIEIKTEKIETVIKAETQKNKEPKKAKTKDDKKSIILWVVMGIALLFWTISFLRVPYIGTFLDSVFFEFPLGWGKYPLYVLLMIYILCIKIPKLRGIFCKKKSIVWYFMPILIFVIILNTIHYYQEGYNISEARDLYLGEENGYITNWLDFYWDRTVIKFDINYLTNWLPQTDPSKYAFGGVIGLIIVSTATWFSSFIIIIALVIWFIVYAFILFNKKYKDKKMKEMWSDFWKKDSEEGKKIKDKENHKDKENKNATI